MTNNLHEEQTVEHGHVSSPFPSRREIMYGVAGITAGGLVFGTIGYLFSASSSVSVPIVPILQEPVPSPTTRPTVQLQNVNPSTPSMANAEQLIIGGQEIVTIESPASNPGYEIAYAYLNETVYTDRGYTESDNPEFKLTEELHIYVDKEFNPLDKVFMIKTKNEDRGLSVENPIVKIIPSADSQIALGVDRQMLKKLKDGNVSCPWLQEVIDNNGGFDGVRRTTSFITDTENRNEDVVLEIFLLDPGEDLLINGLGQESGTSNVVPFTVTPNK